MLSSNSLYKNFFKFSYLETALITLLFLFIGYSVDSADILLIENQISYFTILLAIVTLFHGFGNGAFTLAIAGVSMIGFYEHFNYKFFLNELLFTLIFGEFHYFWNRQIDRYASEVKYLDEKLNELSRAFYTLKISHDQLESNYVHKPMSLRNSIKSIKKNVKDQESFYHSFLSLISKSFTISEAAIALYDYREHRLQIVAKSDETSDVDINDALVQKVFDKKMPIFVTEYTDTTSLYIAVIPAIIHNKIKALLLIEKMPFMSFNKNNLISISILFEYFFDEIAKNEQLADYEKEHKTFDREFTFERLRLGRINKTYGVASTILSLSCDDALTFHKLETKTEQFLRALDIHTTFQKNGRYHVIILFPFADRSAASGFTKRLFEKLQIDENTRIEDLYFKIEEYSLFKQHIGIEDND